MADMMPGVSVVDQSHMPSVREIEASNPSTNINAPTNQFTSQNARLSRGNHNVAQGRKNKPYPSNDPRFLPARPENAYRRQPDFQNEDYSYNRPTTGKQSRGPGASNFNQSGPQSNNGQSINQPPVFTANNQQAFPRPGGTQRRGPGYGPNISSYTNPARYDASVDWQHGNGPRRNPSRMPADVPNGNQKPSSVAPDSGFSRQDIRYAGRNPNYSGQAFRENAGNGGRVVRNGGVADFQDENRSPRNGTVTVRSAPYRGNGQKTFKVDDQNQRERLTDELTKEKLECQFCYERIFKKQSTWSCAGCYNVFHLKCLREWANTCRNESQDGTWRCMICQLILLEEPRNYSCFCGKQESPEWMPGTTPHSCGQVCQKGSAKGNAGLGCTHPCTCLCHPGPCPPCQRSVTKSCGCGKTQIQDQCSSTSSHVCSSACDKPLNCGNHACLEKCHTGPCLDCPVQVEKACHCGRETKLLSCLESAGSSDFGCLRVCEKKLECGNHVCERVCHAGPCQPCIRSPELITKCPCGKTFLKDLGRVGARKSCLDPIPVCRETCEKILSCGTGKKPHLCEAGCHDGKCPSCGKKTAVNCCCGSSTQVVACAQLTPELRQWKCPKICQKKMLCGRHKCENVCCNYDEHVCMKQCAKKLTCGLHQCEDPCGHPGACRRCLNTSFEERTCRCGATIQHPPIPCGAPLPECRQPCSREHVCDHQSTHSCHGDPECPPCTFLCEKMCFGGHQTRRNVPCHVQGHSCGKLCMKPLNCGVHFCKKMCHAGECQPVGETKCDQLCTLKYRKCAHPCNVPCHGRSPCPVTPCKASLDVTCECKLKKEKIVCHQHEKMLKDYLKRKQAQELGGLKMLKLDDLRYAMPVDVLECDDECRKQERNRNLANALNIDPDAPEPAVQPGLPVYGEPLKQFVRENMRWATQVEQSIITLVQTVRDGGLAKRSHQLQPMKYEQRKFVHELAEFYGCQTQSFDQEPVRSITVIAKQDKVQIPSTPLFQVVAAERPAKQTAKCPAVMSRAGGGLAAGMAGHAEKPVKFSWPVELPRQPMRSHKPTAVDYFDVTD